MSRMSIFLYEKYIFQILNALENAYLLPISPDQKRAYRNLKRYIVQAEHARQNLNLITKIADARYGKKIFAPTILLIEGNC